MSHNTFKICPRNFIDETGPWFSGKIYNFMHLERRNNFQKCIKIKFFPDKKKSVPTLPKIFRPVTGNTLIFYLALSISYYWLDQILIKF